MNTLGVDRAKQGQNYEVTPVGFWDAWRKFLDRRPGPDAPSFFGRYFSDGHFHWIPGELNGFIKACPPAACFKYISPVSNPEFWPLDKNKHPLPFNPPINTLWQFDPMFKSNLEGYKPNILLQGQRIDPITFELKPKRKAEVEANGWKAGQQTGERIQKALSYVEPGTGNIELILSESGSINVFLDVEPQTWLHPYFWKGWSDAIATYPIFFDEFPEVALYPLRPCLYCMIFESGSGHASFPKSISSTFTTDSVAHPLPPWRNLFNAPVPRSLRKPAALHAIVAGQQSSDLAPLMNKSLAEMTAAWTSKGRLDVKVPMWAEAIPLAIWQYAINLQAKPDGTLEIPASGSGGFDIDLDVTLPEGLNSGRPITDFMLMRA